MVRLRSDCGGKSQPKTGKFVIGHGAPMNSLSNPNVVHKPIGPYHHTALVPENSRWLVIASGAKAQSEQALRNIAACLEANGMRKEDLVKFTVYLTDARSIADYRAARSKVIGDGIQPASTLVIVAGLANPDLLVEIEAWAAKPML
jgi:enamine deaminase RidA (YjgF/YER057c/UK114 family)